MNEQLITFETAQLAKAKGFDAWTELKYYINNIESHADNSEIENGQIINPSELSNSDSVRDLIIPAPTQALLQKWLREKNIFIEIGTDMTMEPKFNYEIGEYIEDFDWEKKIISELLYRTYEEALEEALIKSLKLLERDE